MPELPEVETVLRTLEKQIKDCKIINIDILYPNIIEDNIDIFKSKLINNTFRNFKRRGKYLLFEMDDITLVSHLRMEGKYFIKDKDVPLTKHNHIVFYLDNNKKLIYDDVRKFGRMSLIEKDNLYENFHDLGPEPFWPKFNNNYVYKYLKNSNLPIKQELLNQSFVAGIGNIYADEICFACKLNPKTISNRLNLQDCMNIVQNTRTILKHAIKKGGTTIRSYTSSLGVTGMFQFDLKVHTKDLCQECGNNIVKTRIGGRGTYYCPICQQNKIRIGITGTIGSGKSMTSAYIKDKGYTVFDCDEYNKSLLDNPNMYYLLGNRFSEAYIDGKIDKKALANIIFNNKKEKKALEYILHPLILDKLIEVANNNKIFFAEVPLMFESGFNKYFDYILLVESNKNVSIDRLKKYRGYTRKQAIERINNQYNIKTKEKLSNEILYNNKSLNDLYKQIDDFLGRLNEIDK